MRIVDELTAVSAEPGGREAPRVVTVPDNAAMTVATFAERSGLSPRRVREMAAQGTIPATKHGHAWSIHEE